MFGFTVLGDLVIGAASFIAGVYFADIVKAPVLAIMGWIVSAYDWIKAKF